MTEIILFARLLRKNPTTAESFFWNRVRGRKFLGIRFRRQHIVRHSSFNQSSFYFIADFYVSKKRLIIKLDGEVHCTQKEYDLYREAILREMGYTIIRFTNEEVLNNWDKVQADLKSILK